MRPPHVTCANVMSTLALFLVLGGGAYAAATMPRNSVGTRQLKRGAVTSRKLRTGAVTSRAVRTHSLVARDFAAGQLHAGPQGATGPHGATGAAGVAGKTGGTGPAGSPAADALLGNSATPLDTAAGQTLTPSGPSTPSTQIGTNVQLTPASPIVARDLNVEISDPPGGTSSRRFILDANDVATDVACTITGTATTCNSGDATALIPAASTLTLLANVSVIPVQNQATVSFGWRATTP